MLTEQSISCQLTDLQNLHDKSSPVSRLPKRKVSWLISLIHYFAFGVDAYVLVTIAEQSAINNAQSMEETAPNPVESISTKLGKHSVVFEHEQFELISLSN